MTLDFVQQIVKFVGGKFRDSLVDHGNNENWHPTKITRYTVFVREVMTLYPLPFSSAPLPSLPLPSPLPRASLHTYYTAQSLFVTKVTSGRFWREAFLRRSRRPPGE